MIGLGASDSEFDFIRWIRALPGTAPGDLVVGPGDDCAVARIGDDHWLFKVDSVLEGTHFQRSDPAAPGYATSRQVGQKAMLRALSDIAAMGGWPRFALIGLALPQAAGAELRESLTLGLRESAAVFDVAVVGGDSKSWSSDRLAVCVSLIGEMRGRIPVLRSGGKPGDHLYVTGPLGGSLLGRHLQPIPRLAEGQWLATAGAHALIDLSDGLSSDLHHLCRESRCGAHVHAQQVPIHADARTLAATSGRTPLAHALHDGEDYELLVAIPPTLPLPELAATWTRIGELTPAPQVWLADGDDLHPLAAGGYEHRYGDS
ncbi:MAG: thiamine-monophosphate kinase [Planctomycetota bacterium]